MFSLKKLIVVTGISLLGVNLATANPQEIKGLVQFLTSPELLILSKDDQLIPPSYYTGSSEDIAKYFGDYVCMSNDTCSVTDSVYNSPFAILGQGLPPYNGTEKSLLQAQAQIERTDMKYGTDIYDAATWQIALALAAKNNYLSRDEANKLITNQFKSIAHKDNRATDDLFQYGYTQAITNPEQAFSFRLVATNFINKDPFYKGRYQDYIHWDYNPEEMAEQDPNHHTADYFKYVSTWSDAKPITGENAWAQLIGPLQAEAILNNGEVDAHSPILNNAINSLYAFSAMQAGIGAFYYAPGGSQGNQGTIPQGEISLENNFSVLGGLQTLKHILEKTDQTPNVKKALADIQIMLYGGKTVNGYETLGLLSFLYNGAFDAKKGIFYTHGTAVDPKSLHDWQPDRSEDGGSMAVDINTWGISALGAETIDKWYGKGTALSIWKKVRQQGGYYNNGQLWGVGYTLRNNSGDTPERIMSTEWTAGAINTLQSLIAYYDKTDIDTSELKDDLTKMTEGVRHLRNDNYLAAQFDGATPKEYFVRLPKSTGLAYLYASKRFPIPFGWNANTLPSTTSNSWIIMNEFRFNPFQYLGRLEGEKYDIPKSADISSEKDNDRADALPQEVNVRFTTGDLSAVDKLSLSYTFGSESTWHTAGVIEQQEGMAFLPQGASMIAIAYYYKGWFGACQIKPATKICEDNACSKVKTIVARWSVDGKGTCSLQ